MKRAFYLLILLFAANLIFLGCQKNAFQNNDADAIEELKSWLKTNGQNFSNGNITLNFSSSTSVKGNLNWSTARIVNNSDAIYTTVPFTFDQSNYKNKKIIYDAKIGELPTSYNLVLRKNNNTNIIEALVVATQYKFDKKTNKKILNKYYYNIKGEILYGISKSSNEELKKLTILINYQQNTQARTCELVDSDPIRIQECWGTESTPGNYNMTCAMVSRVVKTYRCTFDIGAPDPAYWWLEGEGGGWEEYEESQYANQAMIDTLAGYPCAQDVLKELFNCNDQIKALFDSVFTYNGDTELHFTVDHSLTKDSADGYSANGGGGAQFFMNNIYLNPWVLQNSSKDYIAVTLMHESLHAYMNYWYVQYMTGVIDSNEFKIRFPIFWDYNRPRSNSELQHHNQMASAYINFMVSYLKNFNTNISDEMAYALAWGGLSKTTNWASLDDTQKNNISRLNRQARRDGVVDTVGISSHHLKNCN